MSWFILQVLPYITVAVFVVGILYRLGRWAGARIEHNITLAPFPKTNGQVVSVFAKEVIFFRSLFKSDFAMWIGGWLMHIALFSIIGGHVMGIYFLGKQFAIGGLMTEEMSEFFSNLLGTSFGILVFIALLYLLYRRVAIKKVSLVSSPSDYLHLILLLSIVFAGNFMRLVPEYATHYIDAKEYITSLVTFMPVTNEAVLTNVVFVIHMLLVQILLMIFPFSKLMHVLGMFAERWIINRKYTEPAPGLPNVDIKAARAAGLGLPSAGGSEIDANL